MEQFKKGDQIKTLIGIPVVVEDYLAGGGQGDVYIVSFNGEKKALKWYKPSSLHKPDLFYDNLKRNAAKGSPDPAFLWPIAVTERINNSFGYVMDLRPEGYYEVTDFLLASRMFTTFKAATEACIRIVSAFRILHNKGYCYQDINSGNFFINPKTGDVKICDTDNVSPNGTETFILGTPQYMAPEIVLDQAKPSTQTDRFSLSVVLFMLLCMNHPLEGKHWAVPCLTPAIEKKLYGSEALFIYDPKDAGNRPVREVHVNCEKRWAFMPAYIKEAFLKAFSQQAIKNPGARLRELDWLKVLVRFQSDIVRCPACGGEVFILNAASTKCDCCGRILPVKHTLKFSEYSVTAAKGTRVYRCQLGVCNADEALEKVALVVAKEGNAAILGLRNMTRNVLIGTTPSGKENQVKPGDVIPLKAGISLQVYDSKIMIQ